jgi:hypothetical protein
VRRLLRYISNAKNLADSSTVSAVGLSTEVGRRAGCYPLRVIHRLRRTFSTLSRDHHIFASFHATFACQPDVFMISLWSLAIPAVLYAVAA